MRDVMKNEEQQKKSTFNGAYNLTTCSNYNNEDDAQLTELMSRKKVNI